MARYNTRDLLGHWVKLPPPKNENGMCPHPCCRGRRPHPDRFPLMLPAGVLRSASVAELEKHLQKESVGNSGRAVSQVVRELDRRERATERTERRRAEREARLPGIRERAKASRRSRAEEYRLYVESEFVKAEEATRGNMLNKRGRAAGIDPRALWSANDGTRAAYASEELRLYWNDNRIVSAKEFRGGARAQTLGATRRRESRLYGVY